MFVLASIVCVLLATSLIIDMITKGQRTRVDFLFLSMLFCIVVWTGTSLIEARDFFGFSNFAFLIYFKLLSIILLPILILMISFYFINKPLKRKYRLLVWLFALMSFSLVLTNDFHNLVFINYSLYRNDVQIGTYFYIHLIFSYACMLVAYGNLIGFSIKNAGFFSRQALLLVLGACVSLVTNSLYLLGALGNMDPMPFAFIVVAICFYLAIMKYDFLKFAPIAHQTVMDSISDAFSIIDLEYKIVQFNKSFYDDFNDVFAIKLKANVLDLFRSDKFKNISVENIQDMIHESIKNKEFRVLECSVEISGEIKHFLIEFNPIFENYKHKGTIMLLKDITQRIQNIDLINRNEVKLLRAEKYSFLGEVTGGLTHIIKNKITSISYYAMFFENILPDYYNMIQKIEDEEKKAQELQFYLEMEKRLKAIYSSVDDVQVMVTNITRQMSELARADEISAGARFTLEEFLHRIDSFIRVKAKDGSHIEVIVDEALDGNISFRGVLANFVQVIMNLFLNSIYEYKKLRMREKIILKIEESKKDRNKIDFHVIDSGGGISASVKESLFKRMVTTKGNEGAGISLYTAASVVAEKLDGNIRLLESDQGAHFVIQLAKLHFASAAVKE
jgi:two-component system, NtrC family, sensor histidine kinase HupT/HoxJ